jgi:hypothetical protein
VKLPKGTVVRLSRDKHNALQIAVIKGFGPRFAPGARLLYLGDKAKKNVICASKELARLNIDMRELEGLPDIIVYAPQENRLFLIEAATAHGPIGPKRRAELESMFAECSARCIYVTAFLDRTEFAKHLAEIAWETEVWLAESPEHMIHFNGRTPLGPYEP